MKASNDLFDLVQALSPSERRYIKMKASFHGGSKHYLYLLSLLEKQKKYDPQQIRKKWQKQDKVPSLSATQNYLYEFVLSALEQFHADKGDKIPLQALLKKVDILFDKALYKQCVKLLRKARRLAAASQSNRLLLELMVWELRIMLTPQDSGRLNKSVDDIFREEARVLRHLSMINAARHLRFNIEAGSIPEPQRYEEWKAGFSEPMDPWVACEYYRSCAVYLHYTGNTGEAVSALQREVRVLEEDFDLRRNRTAFSKYESSLELTIRFLHEKGDLKSSRAYLRKLDPGNLPPVARQSGHLFLKSHVLYFTLLLDQHILEDKPEALQKTLRDIEQCDLLWQQDLRWKYIAPLLYTLAVGYRAVNELPAAVKILHMLLGEPRPDGRKRIFLDATWLLIILYYERENREMAGRYLESVKRRLKKESGAEEQDRHLLRLFKGLLQSSSPEQAAVHFRAFRDNASGNNHLIRQGVFDYAQWCSAFIG